MGASGWNYFTPYRDDPREALDELRDRVCAAGDYGNPLLRGTLIGWLLTLLRGRVRSIDELLEKSAEGGTHSILDITSISGRPGPGRAWPLSDRDVEKIFGTPRPTRAHVEAHQGELAASVDRWQATYLVVYDQDQPAEYYFEGCSGD